MPATLRRPLAVDVLDGRLVPPHDPLARQAEHLRDAVAVLRARRPAAQHDRQDAVLVHAGPLGQLPRVEAVLATQLIDTLEALSHRCLLYGLRPNCGPWPYTCDTWATWPK